MAQASAKYARCVPARTLGLLAAVLVELLKVRAGSLVALQILAVVRPLHGLEPVASKAEALACACFELRR